MAEPGDRQAVGTWLRLSSRGDLLGAGSDVFFDGVAPYRTREYWRIGSFWGGSSCATNRLLVGESVRDLLRPFGVRLLQMDRMLVVDAGLRWESWRESEFWDRAHAWPRTQGLGSIHDLTDRTPRRSRAKVIRNPPVWQLLGHEAASIDSEDHPCIWDPVYDDGHRVLLRDPMWRTIAEWDARQGDGRLQANPFFLPEGWSGVRVPDGGWKAP